MDILKLRKNKEEIEKLSQRPVTEKAISPQHILVAGAGLEVLRDIRERIERMEMRVASLERKFDERVPERVLSESRFKEEVKSGDEMAEEIISEVKELARKKHIIEAIEEKMDEKLSVVEMKRIKKITGLLEQHERLSSMQLAQLMDMSRTRCNEYFKLMERLRMVEPVLIGKEKFYRLI